MSATETKGLAPFMRELRKVIPEAVKLDKSSPTYQVGGRLILELNYYCRYSADVPKEEKERTCFPASITIKVDDAAIAKLLYGPNRELGVTGSKVYSTRTIQVNEEKPLEESLKRISVAVNKAIRACDNWIDKKRQEISEEAAFDKMLKEKSTAIYKELGSPKSMSINCNGVSSKRWGAGIFNVDIDIKPDRPSNRNHKEYFDVDISGLSLEQFRGLLPIIRELVASHAKSKSGSDSSDES